VAQKVFVIMGNDYPAAVFTTEAKAETFIKTKKAEDTEPSRAQRVYWRARGFWLDQIEPDESVTITKPAACGKTESLIGEIAGFLKDRDECVSADEIDDDERSESARVILSKFQQLAAYDWLDAMKAALPQPGESYEDFVGRAFGSKPSGNSLLIIQGDDSQSLRHGGMRQYRHFTAYVNGLEVRTFADDRADTDWSSGEYLDRAMDAWISTWETALACKCERSEKPNRIKLITK
jgi:hypothetical protein